MAGMTASGNRQILKWGDHIKLWSPHFFFAGGVMFLQRECLARRLPLRVSARALSRWPGKAPGM